MEIGLRGQMQVKRWKLTSEVKCRSKDRGNGNEVEKYSDSRQRYRALQKVL